TTRNQTDRVDLFLREIADADVVGARQSSPDENAAARGANIRIVRRARGYGQVQVAVFENLWTLAIPVFYYVGHALAAYLWDEESAIEENCIGPAGQAISLSYSLGTFKKCVQVLGDGRVGNIGKAQLTEQATFFFLGEVASTA